MPGVYKRKSDIARGASGRWTTWWIDEHGRRRNKVGFMTKASSLELARKLQHEADLIREGLLDPKDHAARLHCRAPIRQHTDAYCHHLIHTGATTKHALHVSRAIDRLFCLAKISTLSEIRQDHLEAALAETRTNLSSRTTNHVLGATKAFLRWCHEDSRIGEVPRWLTRMHPFPESMDRRRIRRVLSDDELDRLLTVTESGPDEHCYGPTKSKHQRIAISGPDRVVLYRLAMGTGFRDKELRNLTPEDFNLIDGYVTCRAAYTKNRREAVQPIAESLSKILADWVNKKTPGCPVFKLPYTSSRMLRRDLARAGIPHKTVDGVVDMHALRHTYISGLIARGADPKTVQILARHSTITLTIDRYSHTDEARKREALEGASRHEIDSRVL